MFCRLEPLLFEVKKNPKTFANSNIDWMSKQRKTSCIWLETWNYIQYNRCRVEQQRFQTALGLKCRHIIEWNMKPTV